MNNLLYSNKSQKLSYAVQVLCVKVFKPKSYKTHHVCVKFVNHIIHPEVSLVLPVLACTKRLEVY